MNFVKNVVFKIDMFQRRRRPLAFTYGVIKKFSDDQAGYQAALVTYYGFLSLFPLLLVLMTVASIAGSRDPEVGRSIVDSVTSYFPVIGQSLEDSVQSPTKSGFGLVVGLLFSLYGARGVANAFRNAINHIWHIPLAKRSGFPRAMLRNFSLIFGGGVGFITASAIAGWASTVGPGWPFRVLSVVLNVLVLYLVFMFIMRASLPLSVPPNKFRLGAAISALGLAALQQVGTLILASITPSSYSALFATTLGLLAWIYLQAQVVMYATVIDTVRDKKLWPRSLSGEELTSPDERALQRRAF